jgi:hypothetical protein
MPIGRPNGLQYALRGNQFPANAAAPSAPDWMRNSRREDAFTLAVSSFARLGITQNGAPIEGLDAPENGDD